MRAVEQSTTYAPSPNHQWNLNRDKRAAVTSELNALSETYGRRDNTPESDRRYLTDETHTGWLDTQTKQQLQQLLDRTNLGQHGLTQLTSLMETSKNTAMLHARDTVNDWDRYTSDKSLLLRLMEHAYNRAGTRALMHSAKHWPPSSPNTGDANTDRSAVSAAKSVLDTILGDRENGSWRRQSMALELVALELEHYHATGEPPSWFKPENMTVSAEMQEMGYSIVNPDPPAVDDTQAMANYIRYRMKLFLPPMNDGQKPTSLEHNVNATLFGDSFVNPYVNWELAGYDGLRDRPLPYHQQLPEERRSVEGDLTEPLNHARLSYRVALQTCMTHREIQVEIAKREPDSLADLVFRTSNLLPTMEDHSLQSAAHMPADSDVVRSNMKGYKPPINWNSDSATCIQELNDITAGFTDVAPLQAKLNRMIEYLVRTHLMESVERQARQMIEQYDMGPADAAQERASAYHWATKTASGIRRMRLEGPAGLDEPQTLLITEAMEAIYHLHQELQRLHSALIGDDLMPLEEHEKPMYQDETRYMALNRLAHIDYCLVAATRTLPPPRRRRTSRTP